MLLPELQALAASLHIPGTARMRKGELIAAIQLAQGAGGSSAPAAQTASSAASQPTLDTAPPANRHCHGRASAAESNGAAAGE